MQLTVKSDTTLQRDVLEELDWEPSFDAAQIGVTAKEGVVTLTGHVPVYAEKIAAEALAKRVHGVKAVANEIEVRPPDSHVRDDADLAAAAVHSLQWDAKTPHERLQVTVRDGRITIEGEVERPFEKDAAERCVRHLAGARDVTNKIRVGSTAASGDKPAGEMEEIKTSISSALRRSATVNSRRIDIEMEGQTLILSGEVHSLAELDEVDRIAWATHGIARLENCITITPWGYGPAEEWGY